MSTSKEKKTKEGMLKLLDRALEQEEMLTEKIKTLETDLAECRQKAENPRHDLDEHALPTSKISFRLDYYKTAHDAPLKGIVEHLSSGKHSPFVGNGLDEISLFVRQFLPENSMPASNAPLAFPPEIKSAKKVEKKAVEKPVPEPEAPAVSSILKKLFPERYGEKPTQPETSMTISPALPVRISAQPFKIVAQEPSNTLRAGHSFQVEIPATGLEMFWGQACDICVCVETLESAFDHTLEQYAQCVPRGKMLVVPGRPLRLEEQGIYRVTAKLNLCHDAGEQQYYEEGRLIVVR